MRGRAKLQQSRRQLARRGDAPPQAHIPFSALPKVGSERSPAFQLPADVPADVLEGASMFPRRFSGGAQLL